MTVSVFEHAILKSLFSEPDFEDAFSVRKEIETMLVFEAELAQAQADCGIISREAADHIAAACKVLTPDQEELFSSTSIDGVIVPGLVQALGKAVGEPWSACVHKGATSQDVIDTGLVLRLRDLFPKIDAGLEAVIALLDALEEKYGALQMMAHTRMQIALPMTVSDKVRVWRASVQQHRAELASVADAVLALQFGGPVGTLGEFGDRGEELARILGKRLGLAVVSPCWHTDRTRLVRLTDWLSRLTGALGKIGQDIMILSQGEIGSVVLRSGGGSSSMPHKNNPVRAEILVTISRFMSVQNAAMHQSLVHENERSGSAWSLEWMVLPQMVVAAGGALRNARELLDQIEFRSQS